MRTYILMNIPQEIFSKIMLFNSHPVSDVFKSEFHDVLHKIKTYYDDEDGDLFYSMWQNHRIEINNTERESDYENDDLDEFGEDDET